LKSAVVNHRFEVMDERLERKVRNVAIGKTMPRSSYRTSCHCAASRLNSGDHTGLCQSKSM
jgi:hypothetical protein